jgi:thioredoxin 1
MPKGKKKTKAVPVKVSSTPALIRLPVIPSVKVTKELVQDVTDSSFETFVKSSKYAILDVWAPWCGPCKAYAPVIESVAARDMPDVMFGKLNADDNKYTPTKFSIRGFPTLLFFKDGIYKNLIVGVQHKDALITWIERNI